MNRNGWAGVALLAALALPAGAQQKWERPVRRGGAPGGEEAGRPPAEQMQPGMPGQPGQPGGENPQARRGMLSPMEGKDSFMRWVVVGAIVLVGAFALFV